MPPCAPHSCKGYTYFAANSASAHTTRHVPAQTIVHWNHAVCHARPACCSLRNALEDRTSPLPSETAHLLTPHLWLLP